MSATPYLSILLLDIALKSFLLLTVIVIGGFCLRSRSAATIHRWWVLGFCGCLALPVIALITPTWTLPILPASSFLPEARLSELTPRDETQTTPSATTRPRNAPSEPAAQYLSDVGEMSHSPPTASLLIQDVNLPTYRSQSERFSWAVALWALWIAGVIVCLIRNGWQQVLLLRLLHHCTAIEDTAWKDSLKEALNSLVLERKVTLLKLREAQSPLTAGLFRSVVILPGDAESWNSARRRLVLLHELAHVKRHDVLTQSVAGLVCALYWFNPLCWYGLFQMRKLRELACDDLVLACGQQPADYADVLLDVARTYCHRSFSTAVGITHNNNVESRILAILDKARSHVSVTRRAARILLVAATVLAMLVGSMRLESQADAPSSTESAEATPEKALVELPVSDNNTRTMVLYVRDDDDVPVPNANVNVRIRQVYMGQDNFTKFQTDELGRLKIAVPNPTPNLFSATISFPGYVPYLAEWMKNDTLDPIPTEYTVYLDVGRKISGIVQDEHGDPIEGVQVSPWFNIKQRPERTRQLGWGRSVTTNAGGEWSFASLPMDLQEVTLTFKHPDFVELRIKEPVSKLGVQADGIPSSVTTMKHGFVFGGQVTDPDRAPIGGARVTYFEQGRPSSNSPTTTSDEDGRYQFDSGEKGVIVMTVSKSGLAPVMKTIEITEKMDAIDSILTTGSPLSVRVVGPDKEPLEGAHISFWIWNDVGVYGSLIDSHGKTDSNGEWKWDNAPQGTMSFEVSLPGYQYMSGVELTPGQENVIEMAPKSAQTIEREILVLFGHVIDAETQLPIPRFTTTAGYKREAKGITYWQQDTQAKERDGDYRRFYDLNNFGFDLYAVDLRVEADGFQPVVIERVIANKQTFKADAALKKAADDGFRVLMPNGKPASDATVAVCTPQLGPIVKDGRVTSNSTCERTITDASGRFSITPRKGLFNLLVLHDSGAALVAQKDLAQSHTISLKPWARVEGTLRMQGKPAANESITLNRVDRHSWNSPKIFYSYQTKTDKDGKFYFEKVVPSNVYVARIAVSKLGGGMRSLLPTIVSDDIQLEPGETAQVELGRTGRQIVGKLVMPDDAKSSVNWPQTMLILQSRTQNAPAPPKIPFPNNIDPEKDQDAATAWWENWKITKEGKAFGIEMKINIEVMNGFKPKYYYARVEQDGTFQFDDIPAGDYQLNAQAYEESEKHAGRSGERSGTLNQAIKVPETSTDGVSDPVILGELSLEAVAK